MAANAQELAQLRDIHLPSPIGWWPLAPGWYFILGLCIAILIWGSYLAWRYHENARAKKQALKILIHYEQEYQRERNSQKSAACVGELLKRVALVYYPRQQVAGLQGEEWLVFLNETGKAVDFFSVKKEITELPYKPSHNQDLSLLFAQAKLWIKQRRGRPCLN